MTINCTLVEHFCVGQAAQMFTNVYVKNFGEDFNEEKMRASVYCIRTSVGCCLHSRAFCRKCLERLVGSLAWKLCLIERVNLVDLDLWLLRHTRERLGYVTNSLLDLRSTRCIFPIQ